MLVRALKLFVSRDRGELIVSIDPVPEPREWLGAVGLVRSPSRAFPVRVTAYSITGPFALRLRPADGLAEVAAEVSVTTATDWSLDVEIRASST